MKLRRKSISERIEDERERQMAKYYPIMERLFDPHGCYPTPITQAGREAIGDEK